MLRTLRFAVAALTIMACAHTSQHGSSTDENLITEEEIDASGGVTAFDVIQKVRRNMLTDRGKTTLIGASPNRPSVFIDGVQLGEIASLRNVSARQLSTIRLYRAWEAQQRYGNGFVGGVIELTTRK